MIKLDNVYFPELENIQGAYEPRAKYGILNVGLSKDPSVITKTRWTYVYYDKERDKLRYLSSYDLRRLREKVLDNGFEWLIVDNREAINAYKLNNELLGKREGYSFIVKNLKLSKRHNTTGFFRVRRNYNVGNSQGFNWKYRYYTSDGKSHALVSLCLNDLHDKVLDNGFEWIIIDKDKAESTCEEYGYCLEDLL